MEHVLLTIINNNIKLEVYMKKLIQIKVALLVFISSNIYAINDDDCPWGSYVRRHKAFAIIGTFPANPIQYVSHLEVYIEYEVTWEARKCGNNPTEYKNLKWSLTNTPVGKPFTGVCLGSYTAFNFNNSPIPQVNFNLPANATATWSVIGIHQTSNEAADKMELDVAINFANHLTPPPGATCGANPQIATIDGSSNKLIFQDSGHGFTVRVNSNGTQLAFFPVVVGAPLSLNYDGNRQPSN
jgi:hypothetical protein